MRETNFIKQNKEKWGKFEKALNETRKDPEELSNLFMEVTDDLSYSRTFYPNRSVRVYLNNLAQRVFYDIYRNRKSRMKKFLNFWKEDVPQIVYESRVDFLISFSVFMLAVIIGVFSSLMDAEFPRVVLGDSYVEMTLRNIEAGKPMSVYQDPNQTSMFFQIAFNNLRVAFICFILGLSFGVGSVFFLMFNGIMLGAFQYLFFQHGVYLNSVLTIWLHGAIEISTIIIAGAAGIHLGKGLLFPGTFTRLQGLQLSSRRALMIYLTIVPLIILAAFIESYITRFSDAPYLLRALLIIFSFVFMFGYFVYYPFMKARKGFTSNLREVELPAVRNQKIEYKKIKNNGQILSESFSFYNRQLSVLTVFSAIAAFIYTVYIISSENNLDMIGNVDFFSAFFAPDLVYKNIIQIIQVKSIGLQWFMNIALISFFTAFILSKLTSVDETIKKSGDYIVKTITATVITAFILNLMLSYNLNIYLWLFIPPFLILSLATVYNENLNWFEALIKSFSYLFGGGLNVIGSSIIIFLMCTIFMFLTTSPILGFFNYEIMQLLPFSEDDAAIFDMIFNCFITSFTLFSVFPIVLVTISLAQHSCREMNEANELLEYIQKLSVKKKSYGMDREDSNDNILS